MADAQPRRRRIDRVTDPALIDGLEQRSVPQLRSLRDECRAEEAQLSYTRRLLQGRIDIARAEMSRRAGEEGAGSILDELPSILADEPGERAVARDAPIHIPQIHGGNRRGDRAIEDAALGRLPDLSDEELTSLLERLTDDERWISEIRRTVLRHLDALQAELVRRYRDGQLPVDELLGAEEQPGGAPADDGAGREGGAT